MHVMAVSFASYLSWLLGQLLGQFVVNQGGWICVLSMSAVCTSVCAAHTKAKHCWIPVFILLPRAPASSNAFTPPVQYFLIRQ
ncbi:hypothetical protein F5Y07DRAFT_353062 [Xylaria sp. FL0933]|nr:hypothetical protein F5Y07DRAFT_353062 [Xylaria sp. FL0933]